MNITLPEIKLVGIKIQTSNQAELNPTTAKIGPLWQEFFKEDLQNMLSKCTNSSKIFSVYTNYESDEHGPYTYFLGREWNNEATFDELATLTIQASKYTKFTSAQGAMPDIVVNTWQEIWKMDELKGQRSYVADFEIYDEKSQDPQNAIVEIYIGVK